MNEINLFLSNYDKNIQNNAKIINEIIISTLPDIRVTLDFPAKMIAYSYGNKYIEMICALFPSKKGLKLSFNRGKSLTDLDNVLQGNGKITRYIEIKDLDNNIKSLIINFLHQAHNLFLETQK